LDALEVVIGLGIDVVHVILDQDTGEALNGAQRGTQVVRDRIGEGFEFLVGRLELGGAFEDAPFEISVQSADFFLGLLTRRNVCNYT
jgi:hypothetical protein